MGVLAQQPSTGIRGGEVYLVPCRIRGHVRYGASTDPLPRHDAKLANFTTGQLVSPACTRKTVVGGAGSSIAPRNCLGWPRRVAVKREVSYESQ